MITLRMLAIGAGLLLATVLIAPGDGQLLMANGDDGRILSPPNLPPAHSNEITICPPCNPTECDSTAAIVIHAIDLMNSSLIEQHSVGSNSTSFELDRRKCDGDGLPVLDDCGCCAVCVRQPNETCGGAARRLGVCKAGSVCWPLVPPKGVYLNESEIGICVGKNL
jgi:hypothetical protein